MSTQFVAEPAESGIITTLERLQPTNPFATTAFFESRRRLGFSTWVIGLGHPVYGLESGCGAFLRRGKLHSTLELISLPNLGAESVFWNGVSDFCSKHGVTRVELGTFASPYGTDPPCLGSRYVRSNRCEFVLDLSGDLERMLSTNHRRNVRKAQKSRLIVNRTLSPEAAFMHHKLMLQSLQRRRFRGEYVAQDGPSPEIAALLEAGAGELFQAVKEGDVLSSVLVLHAEKGSYYQSAGTSPEGMDVGASQFLIHRIAMELKGQGAHVFNLGGADEESTLARFKEGFGASRRALFWSSCYVGALWRYRISRAMELICSDRTKLRHMLAGSCSRMRVYSANTKTAEISGSKLNLEFRPLTPEDIRAITATDPLFKVRQLDRLRRFGRSYAYGVFVDGQIAHVSWLLPPVAIQMDTPRVVHGYEGEAEITGCETLPEFRGRGIYSFAVHNLLYLAQQSGIQRVFMKTIQGNRASQVVIERAGLQQVGWAIIFKFPLTHGQMIWRRFH